MTLKWQIDETTKKRQKQTKNFLFSLSLSVCPVVCSHFLAAMHLWNYFLSNVDALKIHCKNLIIIGLKYIFGNSLLTDYCNFSYSEHLLRSWVFLKPQTEGFGKVQLNVIFFSTISFPLRKPFSFPLGTMSSFFCSFFSVFQMNFFLSLQKKHYHNLFLFPLPSLTFSVYLYFYLLVPIQCIFIIVSLFLLSFFIPSFSASLSWFDINRDPKKVFPSDTRRTNRTCTMD